MGNTTASGGHEPPDVDAIDALIEDMEDALHRLYELCGGKRIDHPSTPAALRVAVDDIADTAARLTELLG